MEKGKKNAFGKYKNFCKVRNRFMGFNASFLQKENVHYSLIRVRQLYHKCLTSLRKVPIKICWAILHVINCIGFSVMYWGLPMFLCLNNCYSHFITFNRWNCSIQFVSSFFSKDLTESTVFVERVAIIWSQSVWQIPLVWFLEG